MFNGGRGPNHPPPNFWEWINSMDQSHNPNARHHDNRGPSSFPFAHSPAGFNPFTPGNAWGSPWYQHGHDEPSAQADATSEPPSNPPATAASTRPTVPDVADGPDAPQHPHNPDSPPHHPHHRRGGGHGRGGFHRGGRGPFGVYGRGGGRHGGWQDWFGPEGGRPPFDLEALSDMLAQQFGYVKSDGKSKDTTKKDDAGTDKDFTPAADVFDTAEAFVVHISLPGAKREDVGCNWNADESELSIAGVIYRPGDEEMLKALALDERQVGLFERKIKLGTREKPASVDSDAIGAKMEDGILIIKVPKVKEEEYVEVKKVDIQ